MSNNIMKRLLKASSNPYASTILDSDVYKIDRYFDSGNIMLNLLMSGKLDGGVPGGKIIELTGDSQTGKSYLTMGFLISYIKQSKNNYVLLFESEAAFIEEQLRKVLTDEENSRFLTFPVSYHEELGKYMIEQLEEIKEIKKENPDINFFVALDSLGMLTPKKIYENTLKGNETKTMNEQQLIKAFFNMIKMPFAMLNVTFVYTNHIYLNYMDMFNSRKAEHKQKIVRGGQGVEYSPDIKIRLLQKTLKEKEGLDKGQMHINKSTEQLNDVTGVNLKVIITKSRQFAKDKTRANIHLRFKVGMDRYSGLIEFLTEHKLIEKKRGGANGSVISIPEINFETTTKEMSKLSKEQFWSQDKLEYIEKKFNDLYLLSNINESIEESLNKNVELEE